MKYLVFAVIFLHILAVAFTVGVKATCDGDSVRIKARLFFIPVFDKTVKLDELLHKNDGAESDEKKQKKKTRPPIGVIKRIITRVITHKFKLFGAIGLSDAAATAYVVGMTGILYTQACAFLCYDDLQGSGITPDYDRQYINLTFDGIFSISLADIIVAVCAVPRVSRCAPETERSEDGYYIAG